MQPCSNYNELKVDFSSLSGSLSFAGNLTCFALSLRKLKPRNSYLSPDDSCTKKTFRSVINILPNSSTHCKYVVYSVLVWW